MSALTPTAEQQSILDAFATGDHVVIEALAGTGKTSTTKMIAESAPKRRMTYIAFNKSVADEAAAKFPNSVTSKTVHSFAHRLVGHKYQDRLKGGAVPAWKTANILRLPERWEHGDKTLRGKQLASLVSESLSRFANSDAEAPSRRHVPKVPGVETPEARESLCAMLEPYILRAWDDICDVNGQLKFLHSYYLKMAAMKGLTLPGDVVLFDEAQDANKVIKQIVDYQDAQKIVVGDAQQAIYGFTGATVDGLSTFETPHRIPLTQSWRFGPAVAEEANRILSVLGSQHQIVGTETVDSALGELTEPTTVLTRTNAEAVARLMAAQVAGRRAGLVGGTKQVEYLAQAALDLSQGRPTMHPELMAFDSWAQVQEHVESESDAKELQVLVKLVDRHGPQTLLDAVRRAVPESQADLTISTSHRAKGRQFPRVLVGSDFSPPYDEEHNLQGEEARLQYVAVTRAQHVLDSTALSWLDPVARGRGETREFLSADEVVERFGEVEAAPEPVGGDEQIILDPENEAQIMIRRTKYSAELVEAQRALPGRRFRKEHCGEDNVNLCAISPSVLQLAEQFDLTVATAVRTRIEEVLG